jgi:septum site-determining protein MinC
MTPTRHGTIEIKGTRKGLSVTLGEGDWPELLHDLEERLSLAQAFFRNSQVNLITGKRDLEKEQIQDLISILEDHSVQPASIRASSEVTADAARSLGLRLALPEAAAHPGIGASANQWISEGLLMRHTLRSGQSLRHPGHVVVVGDVNPGAEIIAGGDVVVWGKLRGMVHAGALGNDDAVVCALELSPTQLRIGSRISRSPDDVRAKGTHPEIASLLDGQIVARPWGSR